MRSQSLAASDMVLQCWNLMLLSLWVGVLRLVIYPSLYLRTGYSMISTSRDGRWELVKLLAQGWDWTSLSYVFSPCL